MRANRSIVLLVNVVIKTKVELEHLCVTNCQNLFLLLKLRQLMSERTNERRKKKNNK